MGIIVSRENQNRTKKVQQTAAVVTALKLASSKESKGKGSPSHSPAASRSSTTPAGLASSEGRNEEFSIEDHDLERREHILNLNYDKSSVSYGLPELNAADSLSSNSGTTGYWDKTDKTFVSIPYFGAWRRRVCKLQSSLISSVIVIVLHFLDQLHSLHFLP